MMPSPSNSRGTNTPPRNEHPSEIIFAIIGIISAFDEIVPMRYAIEREISMYADMLTSDNIPSVVKSISPYSVHVSAINAALAVLLTKSCIFRWKHTIKNDVIQKNSLEKVE